MTTDDHTLQVIQEFIKTLPAESIVRCEDIAQALRDSVKNDPLAALAYSLVGAEMAAQSDWGGQNK